MVKTSLKYGLLCGAFLILAFHLSFYIGSNPLIDIRHLIFDVFAFGVFIFFAQKEFREYSNEGILHFWQGMSIGFLVYIVASVLFCISLILYFQVSSHALTDYQEAARAFLQEQSQLYEKEFGKDGFSEKLQEINEVTPWSLIISSTVKKMLEGLFITPVISIILRKHPL